MKYGIIFFQNTENIGDDIQTYAAIQYLPKIDYIIEREKMSVFQSKENETVKVIMNGWFIHNPKAFPPSPVIKPLIISAHFTNYLRKNELPSYLDEGPNGGLEYLKKYEPIGLRDDLILDLLREKGIDCYNSGCLTTTITPFKKIKKKENIIAVDISEKIVNHISKISNLEIHKVTHKLNPKENAKLSFETRMKNVESILRKYQESNLVITSRLHCLLPCLALNVPVILIYNDKNQDIKNRLGNYLEYVNYFTENEFLNIKDLKKIKFNNKNISKFTKIQKGLKRSCLDFIYNNNSDFIRNIDLHEYFENLLYRNDEISRKDIMNIDAYYKRLLKEQKINHKKQITKLLVERNKIKKDLEDMNKNYKLLNEKTDILIKEKKELLQLNDNLQEDLNRLKNIENLKYYKFVMKPYFAYKRFKNSK